MRRAGLVLTVVLTVGGVATAGGVVAAALTDPPTSREVLLTPANAPQQPAVGSLVRAEAQRVFERFVGSEAERNAGYVLSGYAQNGPLDACMEARGFPGWDWSLARAYAEPVDPFGISVWFSAPMRPFKTQNLLAFRGHRRGEEVMNAVGDEIPAGEDEAISRCLASTPQRSEGAAHRAPVGVLRLEVEWNLMVDAFSSTVADRDVWYRCMTEADLPVLEGDHPSELPEAMSALGTRTEDIPTSGTDPAWRSAGWQRVLAAERQVNAADWSCRSGLYAAHIDDLAPLVARFERAHEERLRRLESEWDAVVAAAEAHGYHGQHGPLGG